MKMFFRKNKGFTLIELLVVVAIISLLSSIVFASLNTARAKARDARRLSDLHQLDNALALYASDHNGSYPGVPPSSVWIGSNTLGLSPYMAVSGIKDPQGNGYAYFVNQGNTIYRLVAAFEIPSNQGNLLLTVVGSVTTYYYERK